MALLEPSDERKQIAVGPMLKLVAPWILPVVEDLTAEDVATDAPGRRAALLLQMVMALHQVVQMRNLECGVIEPRRLRRLKQEERVMVGRRLAAIAAQKCSDGESGAQFNLVGRDEAEARFVPLLRRAKIFHFQNRVTEPCDMRRPRFQSDRRAQACLRIGCVVRRLAGNASVSARL